MNNHCDDDCKKSFDKEPPSLLESMPKVMIQWQSLRHWYDDAMVTAHRTVWATVRTATTYVMIHYMRGFDHARIVVELMHVHMKLLSTQACVNYHEFENCEGECESTHVHQATHAHSGGQSLGVKPYVWLQCIFRVWLPGANRPTSSAWALIAAPLDSSRSTISTWPCRAALIRQALHSKYLRQ